MSLSYGIQPEPSMSEISQQALSLNVGRSWNSSLT